MAVTGSDPDQLRTLTDTAMHEWALAEAVVATAVKAAEQEGLRRITAINLKIGELQQIEREIFAFALKEVLPTQTPLLQDTVIHLATEPAELQCRPCEHVWLLDDSLQTLTHDEQEAIHFVPETAHVYVKCPHCGSPDFAVTKGRRVSVDSITGE